MAIEYYESDTQSCDLSRYEATPRSPNGSEFGGNREANDPVFIRGDEGLDDRHCRADSSSEAGPYAVELDEHRFVGFTDPKRAVPLVLDLRRKEADGRGTNE